MFARAALVLAASATAAFAAFCGDSAVPLSVEVLPSGQTVLGCARPSCFGFLPSGKPASYNQAFFDVNGHQDGFMRPGNDSVAPYGSHDERFFRPVVAKCDEDFTSSSCAGATQWVGGIAPALNVTAYSNTALKCCSYEPLASSEDRGVATVQAGQIVVGGEVFSNGEQIAFDYISDITKVIDATGAIQYDIAIRRFECPAASKPGAGARAFQVPINPANAPLALNGPNPIGPGPIGTNQIEEGILEEVVQQPGLQLTPGTQFQPVFNQQPIGPQFVQQPLVPQFAPPPAYGGVAGAGAAAGAGGGGGGGAGACFTADMIVQLADGSSKRMDELQKGDWVEVINNGKVAFEPVTFWLHRIPEQEYDFHHFELDNGKEIKLTSHHYIYKGDCKHIGKGPMANLARLPREAVFAEEVEEGDCLFSVDKDTKDVTEHRVVRASIVHDTGIYAPMTSGGKILVNDIYASCHNIIQSTTLQQTYLSVADMLASTLSSIFTTEAGVVETPAMLNTLLDMYDIVMPKNLVTM